MNITLYLSLTTNQRSSFPDSCFFLFDHADECILSDNIYDYYNVSQGKVTIPSMDDSEEFTLTDVSLSHLAEIIVSSVCCSSLSLALCAPSSVPTKRVSNISNEDAFNDTALLHAWVLHSLQP